MTTMLPMPLPARVLLLGSGELGKEVTIALKRYGCTVIAADSYEGAPAMQVADSSLVFDMSDPNALREVLDGVDVDLIVPEVEAIATDELSAAEERGVRVVPNAFAVQATMDRQRIRTLAAALTGVVIVEEGIDFDYEITLLTVRSWDAASSSVHTSFCEPIGHRQEDGDYVESWQPMAMSEEALASARHMAKEVTDALAEHGNGPCLGIFGVEFFVRGDQVWFSELSPRPHDTGMVTMVTQPQSEFELHARAILGLPTSTALASPGASAVIKSARAIASPAYRGVATALATADIVRLFGKPISRAGRRVGVVAATATTPKESRVIARRAAAAIMIDDAARPSA